MVDQFVRVMRRFWIVLGLAPMFMLPVCSAGQGTGERDAPGELTLPALRQRLLSGKRRVRRSALKGLVALGEPAAWGLIVDCLGDPAGEVADRAQWLLGSLESEEELGFLLGKAGLRAKSDWVRRRSAEVLGRLGVPVPMKSWLRALKDSDAEVRRMAAWSVERVAGRRAPELWFGERGVGGLLQRLRSMAKGDRELAVRARAWYALSSLNLDAARELLGAFRRSRHAQLGCAALGLARRLLPPEEALAYLKEEAVGEPRLLRAAAQGALAEWGTRGALEVLVETFDVEEDPRLRHLTVQALQRISGLRHRDDARPWRAWLRRWEEHGGRPVLGGRAARRRGEVSSSGSSFSGLKLRSSRLTFLIDFSGSMWTPREDGRTPKELVGEQLDSALAGLPEGARFNVIPYTGKPHPWSERLLPATKRNRKRALAFYQDCHERGSGNVWDAAMLALEDPDVDTLVVLSDGAPSGGQRYELELILSLFIELNLTRRVAVDSVIVDSTRRLEAYWTRLAEGTGGESIQVAFP